MLFIKQGEQENLAIYLIQRGEVSLNVSKNNEKSKEFCIKSFKVNILY